MHSSFMRHIHLLFMHRTHTLFLCCTSSLFMCHIHSLFTHSSLMCCSVSVHVSAIQLRASFILSSFWHISSPRPPSQSTPQWSIIISMQADVHITHCWPTQLLFSFVLDSLNVYSYQFIFHKIINVHAHNAGFFFGLPDKDARVSV